MTRATHALWFAISLAVAAPAWSVPTPTATICAIQVGTPNPTTPCTLTAPGMPAAALKMSFPANPPAPSGKKRLRVAVIDTASQTQFGNGAWVTCTFKIASTAPLGGSTVAGELQTVSDAASRKLPSAVVNGVVTVQ